MSTAAPSCPKCKSPSGTPVNEECGGRGFRGASDSTLRCPACGHGWRGTDIEVSDAWRSFVEWEQKEAREDKTLTVGWSLDPPQTAACPCGHSMAAHDQSMAAPGKCYAGDCKCERFTGPDEPTVTLEISRPPPAPTPTET